MLNIANIPDRDDTSPAPTVIPALSDNEMWISGQRRALEFALGDRSLVDSLGVLIESATMALGSGTKGAFFLLNPLTDTLHHVVGMPDDYAVAVDAMQVGPQELACGLAVHVGQPVLTSDVALEPRWKSWLWLAEAYGYRGCWSFPILAKSGKCVGSLALYFPEPRHAEVIDVERLELVVHTAAIIIHRHVEAEERKRAELALKETQSQLERELADSELLRQLSLELADQDGENGLYVKLVDAAAKIMRSDVCTVQLFHPDRGPAGELEMLASTGLDEVGLKHWKWVRGDSGCTCGQVIRTGRRAIAEEVETCSFMAGTPDRDVLLAGGIKAGQSTPLVTRDGKFVGMISTHWGQPHKPSDRELRNLDIIARTAADLVERKRATQTQQLLLNELNHRVKNTLAVVQAMATRTLARTSDPKEFAKSFGGRVQALARVHDLLTAKSWHGADLRDIVSDQVSAGSADETRLSVDGPSVNLDPQMALHVALIVHEMGTNATKYGALSVPTGRVAVSWEVTDALHIRWLERGGPVVSPATSFGFGTTLITQSARGQRGSAIMTSEPAGIQWDVTIPYKCKSAESAKAEEKEPPQVGYAADPAKALAGRRILVVEDEPLIGLDIMAALEDANAIVDGPVATVEEAIVLIERYSYDVALLDANLHGRSVEAVASALRSSNVPFAFATGYDREGLPEGFRDLPILSKPCGPETVLQMAARLLSR